MEVVSPKNKYLALLIGHDQVSQGAIGKFPNGDSTEYKFHYFEIAPLILNYGMQSQIEIKIFDRNFGGITKAYELINSWLDKKPKGCAIELHHNAFNGSVQGTETLFDLEPKSSEVLAKIVQDKLCQAFRRPGQSRGVKLTEEGRGSFSLKACKHPSCLTEAFFGDNIDDARKAWEYRHDYAKAIVTAADEFLSKG